jgi:hypothetical protein
MQNVCVVMEDGDQAEVRRKEQGCSFPSIRRGGRTVGRTHKTKFVSVKLEEGFGRWGVIVQIGGNFASKVTSQSGLVRLT